MTRSTDVRRPAPVLATPSGEEGDLDRPSLERLVGFLAGAGFVTGAAQPAVDRCEMPL